MNREHFFAEVVSILEERESKYVDPVSLFRDIASIWTAVLGSEIEPEQVVLCMIGLKLARLSYNWSHADSIKDVAGYAAILSQLVNEAPAE
jgi:hypothetical protein